MTTVECPLVCGWAFSSVDQGAKRLALSRHLRDAHGYSATDALRVARETLL